MSPDDNTVGPDGPAIPDAPAFAYDPETLRETPADEGAARSRLPALRLEIRDAPDEIAELVARGDLVELLRGLGDADDALHEAQAAAIRADMAGSDAQQHTARVRLAQVHQWRGDFAESNLEFTELLAAADQFGPIIEAYTHQRAGENDYDQAHWDDACVRFARALALRAELELDDAAQSQVALAAATHRRDGATS